MTASSPAEGKIGIVAIGRNEGARLVECLRSLVNHTNAVIYADSASSDGSADVARNLGIETVVLPADSRLTAAAGRVAGFKRLMELYCGLDSVQFIDGDCLLDPSWLSKAAAFLRSTPQAAVVCGRRFEAEPEASIFNAMCDEEWNTPVGRSLACGGDALFRIEAYEAVGGFNAGLLAGEEPELCERLRSNGWEIWRIDAKMTEHDARMSTLGQFWRRSIRGGFGYAQVWSRTRNSGTPLYARQLVSALSWAVILPLTVVAIGLAIGSVSILLMLPIVYLLQAMRIYSISRRSAPQQLGRAVLTLFAKFPESLGAARYFIQEHRSSAPAS